MERSTPGGSGATLDSGGIPVPDFDVLCKERLIYPPPYSLDRVVATLEREDWNAHRTLFNGPEDEARTEAMKEALRDFYRSRSSRDAAESLLTAWYRLADAAGWPPSSTWR